MSVALLEPPRPEIPDRSEDVVNAPLSACLFTGYIYSVLRENNIEAQIINAHLYGWSIEQTVAEISKNSFRLLCVHTVYLWDKTHRIFDMLSALKSENVTAHINLYGYYPTFAYKEILTVFPFIDSVTVGEPEFTILDLAIKIGLENNFSIRMNIPGLAFKDIYGEVVYRPRAIIHDLDTLPYPERHDAEIYREKGLAMYIQGSRGCYGDCTFCYLNSFYGQMRKWRCRSAENIFWEIDKLYTEYNIRDFYFSDANFFGPGMAGKERAVALAGLIVNRNLDIRFGFECRANDVAEDTIARLCEAGLANVFLGLESGDPDSLRRFGKRITPDENRKAIQLLRKYGIEPTFGFIMFEPNSTLKSVRNNFSFLKEMNIMTRPEVTAHLLYHRQTLFKGTSDYRTSLIDGTANNNSFTRYEAYYTIKDKNVEIFSRIISAVCRRVLSFFPETDEYRDITCNTGITSVELKGVNDALIDIFERTLTYFENHGNVDSLDAKEGEIGLELMHEVESLMSRFSVSLSR